MTYFEKELLNKAFDSNWISPNGPDIDIFENNISKYLRTESSCALSSGTAALHLALNILGVKKNDIVLCSSLTFIASANSIIYQGAKPVFIDSDPKHWTLDLQSLETAMIKYKPKVLISVDIYGQSCNYKEIVYLCNKYHVLLIEDAAESLGSEYYKTKCGSFGDIGIISFNGNKIITTSSGGLLTSNNINYVKRARFLSTQARENVLHYEHKEIGFNYRMSNLLASVGIAQLKNLDTFVRARRRIFKNYYDALKYIDRLNFMIEAENNKSNRWLSTFTIEDEKVKPNTKNRDLIISKLKNKNIEARPVWKPMHMQPVYKGYDYISDNSYDVSKKLFYTGICLPSGSSLTKNDQARIINYIQDALKE